MPNLHDGDSMKASPDVKARVAGVFYLLTILAEGFWLLVGGKLGFAAKLIATASYIPVTLLFYYIFKPVHRSLSLLAASLSLVGIVIGVLLLFHLAPFPISPLVFSAFYFLLIGYLIFRSTFLPRILGALLALGGLGLLTFLSPPLAKYLFPYNLAPAIFGGGVLTLWLLVRTVNVQRWQEQASAAVARSPLLEDPMLNRLLPRQVDNAYHGYKLALWLFGLVVFMKVAISLNAIFNGYMVASGPDRIPLDAYTPAGAQAVVSLFAAWGLAQFIICLLCVLVLARYRALVPFMFGLLLVEHLSRRLIFLVMPIVRTGTPPGFYVNLVLLALMIVGLALSLRRHYNLQAKEQMK